jgi:predicted Zn-dependent protease with MMP-like domain
VSEAIDTIPRESLEKLTNVVFKVEKEPSPKILRENGVPDGWTLFGLYHGIPRTERGDMYGVGETLPDTITIFQGPIEDEAEGDSDLVRQLVYETVLHEVAHYFGMDEAEVEMWEKKHHT